MSETFNNSNPPTSADTPAVTSSEASAAGTTPSPSPAGPQLDLFGQEVALANPSRRRARERAKKTNAISGRHGWPSSASVALTASLGSRLQAATDTDGSMECELTWKRKATPSGLRIYRLQARARRTSGNGSGGLHPYGTPAVSDWQDVRYSYGNRNTEGKPYTIGLRLAGQVQLAIHPTPESSDASGGRVSKEVGGTRPSGAKRAVTLGTVQALATHATLAARDHKSESATEEFNRQRDAQARGKPLSYEATQAIGTPSISSTTETEKRGVLNPELSRWLMGYPPAWSSCAATATRSYLKRRRSSSKPSLKRRPNSEGGAA
jgi:hypothetical protein